MKQLKYLATLVGLVLIVLLLQQGYVIEGFDFLGLKVRKPNTEQPTPNTNPQPTPNTNNQFVPNTNNQLAPNTNNQLAPNTNPQPALNPNNQPTQQPIYNPPPPPRRTSIFLAYAGDMYGCVLTLSVRIGDKRVRPQGSFFEVSGVEPGWQDYRISGQIGCPGVGTCQASGEGSIDVSPDNTYNVIWQNVGIGQCSVMLNEQF